MIEMYIYAYTYVCIFFGIIEQDQGHHQYPCQIQVWASLYKQTCIMCFDFPGEEGRNEKEDGFAWLGIELNDFIQTCTN
jgi:hypothetical protein